MTMRSIVSSAIMRSSCWYSDRVSASPHPGFYRSRIWTGLLAGSYLSMQRLERPAMLLGIYEPHVAATLRHYVRPGDTAFDVGAHIGYMTAMLAHLVGPTGQVFAFEPDPVNLTALRRNVAENQLAQVAVVPAAVSATVGVAAFARFDSYSLVGHLARSDTPDDRTLVEVDTVSLDEWAYGRGHPAPRIIKIDVEGAEMQVLEGAERLMREARPMIIVEMRVAFRDYMQALLHRTNYRLELLRGTPKDWERKGMADILLHPMER